jgi:hypothetical protein
LHGSITELAKTTRFVRLPEQARQRSGERGGVIRRNQNAAAGGFDLFRK